MHQAFTQGNAVTASNQCNGVVGIVTKTFRGSYYGRMVQCIADFMQERGYLAVVQSCDLSQGNMDKWLHLQASQCDGLIIHSDTLSDEALTNIFEQYPATILMNRYLRKFPSRCVYLDNRLGGALAAKYLVQQGHTSVAMVTGPSGLHEVKERTLGFNNMLDKYPDAHCRLHIESDFNMEGGAVAMETIVNSKNSISAVFFQNDDMAYGALAYCQKLGISIPEAYSIIGYDDLLPCNFTQPRLTSIHQPLEAIGEAAAAKLHKLLSNEEQDKKTTSASGKLHCDYFLPTVTERNSVARMPDDHHDHQLSDREVECLTWTAKGKTSWEISVILGIAECTVSFHLRNVGKKLCTNNRTHSVTLALQHGLIRP